METDRYSFDGKLLTIVDPEMGLRFSLPFIPVMLPEEPKAWEALPSGHMVSRWGEGEFVVEHAGQPDGQYRLYDKQKHLKAEMYYLKGKLHGPSEFYGEKGQELSKSWFVEGKKQGKCRWYYPNGELYSLQRYLDGLLHGRQEYYFIDGTLKTFLIFEKGELVEHIPTL